MNQIIKTLSFALVLFVSINSAKAQEAMMPNPSSGQTVIQEFGLGKVTLTYNRPNTKGRKIFGGLEAYGKVWRTGANGATALTFTDEVTFGGKTIPAGIYALFTIPTQNEWTIILSKNTDQWGAYDYKEAEDLIRVSVKPTTAKSLVETLTIGFSDVKAGSMNLNIVWENTTVTVPLTINYDAKVMANIDKAMAGDKKPYFAAAQYYYENDKDINKALEWVNEAEKADAKAPWFKLWKARIQLKAGDKAGAKATAEAGLKLAQDINNEEYVRLHQTFLAQIK
jgi:hypothetical protein